MEFERIERASVPAMDELVGKVFPVLDKGHIRVIDYMGGDQAIVQAARVSYGKGTKKVSEDRGLIRYLMRHRHTTPFEMCEVKVHIRIPMDAWRQMIRHRTANVNEYSTRYSEAIDDKQCVPPGEWRLQSGTNKQGSGDYLPLELGEKFSETEEMFHTQAAAIYQDRINAGIAREQARKDLPLSTYTEAYWKIDLHNLFHYLGLRMDSHAQLEIRSYADVLGREIVSKWCPLSWEAFEDYRLNAMYLTRLDVEMLTKIVAGDDVRGLADSFGWLNAKEDGTLKANRERQEFDAKLLRLGVMHNW